jgi:phasin family protein
MNQVSQQFKQVNQAGVEVMATVAGAAFSVLERIAALNLSAARGFLQQRQTSSRKLLSARDAQTLLSLQAQALIDDSKQAMDYSQRAIEISLQSRDSLNKVLGYPQPGRFPAQ